MLLLLTLQVLVQLQRLKVLKNPSESEREKRKGKGKVVESTPKREDRKYVTRGTAQKLLGDAMVANKAQTIRNRRERKTDNLPVENPIVLTQDARSSDTESEDIVRAVAKWQKEAEEQRVKAQRTTRSSNKSPAKRARVNTRAVSKPKPVKGPGPAAKGKDEDKVLTREEELQNSRSRRYSMGGYLTLRFLQNLVCALFFTMYPCKVGNICLNVQCHTYMSLRYASSTIIWTFLMMVDFAQLCGKWKSL